MDAFPNFRPLSTAPIDEWVLLATAGGWVGQAIYGEDEEAPRWRWADSTAPIHADLPPLGWMPLPPAIETPA
jgi:hypothetical protein